jgi:hypothetical protein
MANLTIVVPDEVLKQARQRAVGQGTSVNAVLRNYLGQYAGVDSTLVQAAERVLAISDKARSGRGKARWTRDDLYDR